MVSLRILVSGRRGRRPRPLRVHVALCEFKNLCNGKNKERSDVNRTHPHETRVLLDLLRSLYSLRGLKDTILRTAFL